MLEFAIKIHTATTLSWQPQEISDQWKRDFVQRAGKPILPNVLTNEQKEAEILVRCKQMVENFMKKVSERETFIRNSRAG